MSYRYLFSVDPSLTCSGWALFCVKTKQLIAVGKIASMPARYPLAERLLDLQSKIASVLGSLKLGSADILICESPTTMKDPHAAIKVEQVRSIFEALGRELGISVPGRINPRSVQYEVLGLSGRQMKRALVKETAVDTVYTLYGANLKKLGFQCNRPNLKRNQDIVDAILIGSLAVTKLATAKLAGISINQAFCATLPSRSGKVLVR